MKGTWRFKGGTWGVHERSKPSLNEGYMENQRGYMGGTWEIRPQSQWRVHGEAKGVHEGYMRDRNPVSMKGTWRIEGGTWGVHERLKPTLNKRGTWGLLWVHAGSIPNFNVRYMSITLGTWGINPQSIVHGGYIQIKPTILGHSYILLSHFTWGRGT